MDVALRAVSWIWGFHFFARLGGLPRSRDFAAAFLRALFMHGEFVVNAPRESRRQRQPLPVRRRRPRLPRLLLPARRRSGRAVAGARPRPSSCTEIFKQIDADGVDFEQSTAYHRLVLEAFLTSYLLLAQARRARCRQRAGSGSSACASSSQAYTKPDGRAPLIGDADDGRIQILGTQAIGDHRYLLSNAAVLFGRGDFKAAAGRCWDETVLAARPGRAASASDALPRRTVTRRRRRFPTAGSSCCAADDAHVVRRLRRGRHARPRRTRPQRHPELRAVPERHQRRHRLRRVSVHRVARMAEPVSEHGVSQHACRWTTKS